MEACKDRNAALEGFGLNVQARRRKLGITQAQLADAIGTTRQTVSAWEAGRHAAAAPLMRQLAKALRTTPRALWPGWTPDAVPRGGNQATTRRAA